MSGFGTIRPFMLASLNFQTWFIGITEVCAFVLPKHLHLGFVQCARCKAHLKFWYLWYFHNPINSFTSKDKGKCMRRTNIHDSFALLSFNATSFLSSASFIYLSRLLSWSSILVFCITWPHALNFMFSCIVLLSQWYCIYRKEMWHFD